MIIALGEHRFDVVKRALVVGCLRPEGKSLFFDDPEQFQGLSDEYFRSAELYLEEGADALEFFVEDFSFFSLCSARVVDFFHRLASLYAVPVLLASHRGVLPEDVLSLLKVSLAYRVPTESVLFPLQEGSSVQMSSPMFTLSDAKLVAVQTKHLVDGIHILRTDRVLLSRRLVDMTAMLVDEKF